MKCKHPSNGANEETEVGDIKRVFCEPSEGVKLGDLIWVKLHPSSWWPAQVVDAETVSECVKPSERLVGEVLVRVYGSYIYLYVDPSESRAEFEKVLKRYDGNRDAILKESLHKDRPRPTKSKGLVVSEVSQSTIVGSELISDVKPEEEYNTQGNEEDDDLSSTVISDIVAESRPHGAMKKKSKNKKTAVADNKTSPQRQRNISARGMLARMKLESDFENGNLESEVSSPTLFKKTRGTKRKSQLTKPETESARLSPETKGKVDDNPSSPRQPIGPVPVSAQPNGSKRSKKIMQSLGLVAPSSSLFDRKIQHS